MSTHPFVSRLLAVALTAGLAVAAPAAQLSFENVTPAAAAAQLGARYHAKIVLKDHFGSQVSFTVDDADAPGARLQAVNALANALGAEFTKTYIIEKAIGRDPGTGAFDSAAKLPAGQKTLSAREAMRLVGAVDDAQVKTIGDLDGTVTLSDSSLPVAQAAAEVAQQTGTRWLTVYEMTAANRDVPSRGTVIGHTAAGTPIIEYAAVYFPGLTPERPRPPRDGPPAPSSSPLDSGSAPVAQQLLAQQQLLVQQQMLLQQRAGSGSGYFIPGVSMPAYSPYGNGASAMPYPANGLILQGNYGGF